MNEYHVGTVAERHKAQLETARGAAAQRTRPRPGEVFDRDIGALAKRLSSEAESCCAAYNAEFRSERLICENHEHGVNVEAPGWRETIAGARLHLDLQRRKVERCQVQISDATEKFSVEIVERGDGLVILLDGAPTTEEAVITALLDSFTTRLTEAEVAEI